MKRTTLNLPDDIHRRLLREAGSRQAATTEHTTASEVVADILDKVLPQLPGGSVEPRQCYEIIGAHINRPIGVCHGDDGMREVLAEEPGSTFRAISKAECSICRRDEPPAEGQQVRVVLS